MSDKQNQKTSTNAIAIQSGRDTNIEQGVTTEDMKEIIEAIHAQMPTYVAIAREVVDARLQDFEDRLLRRFAEGQGARAQAFADPDFQYLLTRANHAYARSGDERVHDTLVDLIAQRSMQTDRNRLALSLNEAIEKSTVLTRNEFAELSLAYLVKYTMWQIGNQNQLFSNLNKYISPLVPDLSKEDTSYSYLEAQSCASISIGSVDLTHAFKERYLGLLAKGFSREQLEDRLPDGKKDLLDNLLIPCLNDQNNLQFKALNLDQFMDATKDIDLDEVSLKNCWDMFANTMFNEQELKDFLRPHFSEVDELFDIWQNTQIKKLTLTSVGIAIGHANLVRIAQFDADLSIWIR